MFDDRWIVQISNNALTYVMHVHALMPQVTDFVQDITLTPSISECDCVAVSECCEHV